MADLRIALQSSVKTAASGLFSRKALAAVVSNSMAQQVLATPDWCRPSDNPPQPAKMSKALSGSVTVQEKGRCPEPTV